MNRTLYVAAVLSAVSLAGCAAEARSGADGQEVTSPVGGDDGQTPGSGADGDGSDAADGSDPNPSGDATGGGDEDAGTEPTPAVEVDELPDSADLSADGPRQVTEMAVSVPAQSGSLSGTAYLPGGEGSFPLVIVLPGFQTSYTAYAMYARHMATWGFGVIGIDFTDPGNHPQSAQDVLDTIDWAEQGESPFGASIDTTRVATAGHSAGGKVAYFAATLDPVRIKAVIGWDPVNAAGPPCGVFGAADDPMAGCNADAVAPNPVSGQAGLMDTMAAATVVFGAPSGAFSPMEHHAVHFYEGAKTAAMYVLFPNGSHLNWGPLSAATEEGVCKPTGVAWLFRYLKGEVGPEIDAHIPPSDAAVQVMQKN